MGVMDMQQDKMIFMEFNINQPILNEHPSAKALIDLIKENYEKLLFEKSTVYNHFPLIKIWKNRFLRGFQTCYKLFGSL